ncbi:MAG TPA: hypothetical protein VN426_08565 [Syntrophomonadaceae bacterium]|nr:hypothetical protein [Syntrophomonadaceae bacterium]
MTELSKMLLKQQKEQKKTLRDLGKAILYALLLFAGGAGYLYLTGFSRSGNQDRPLYWLILWMPGIIMLLTGGFRLLYYPTRLLARKRKLTCPDCGTRHTVWKKVQFLACSQCLLPLYIMNHKTELIKFQCPHCGKNFASNQEEGAARCLNCGAQLNLESGQTQVSEADTCSSCQAQHPRGVFACPECGQYKIPIDPVVIDNSLDSMLARGRDGLLWHWKGKLQAFLLEMEGGGDEDIDAYFHIQGGLYQMMEILAVTDLAGEQKDDFAALVEEVDRIYALSLLKTYSAMKAHPEARYHVEIIETLFRSRKPARQRQELQVLLSDAPINKSEIWHRPLINKQDYTAYAQKLHTIYSIENPEELREEALRVNPALAELPAASLVTS